MCLSFQVKELRLEIKLLGSQLHLKIVIEILLQVLCTQLCAALFRMTMTFWELV